MEFVYIAVVASLQERNPCYEICGKVFRTNLNYLTLVSFSYFIDFFSFVIGGSWELFFLWWHDIWFSPCFIIVQLFSCLIVQFSSLNQFVYCSNFCVAMICKLYRNIRVLSDCVISILKKRNNKQSQIRRNERKEYHDNKRRPPINRKHSDVRSLKYRVINKRTFFFFILFLRSSLHYLASFLLYVYFHPVCHPDIYGLYCTISP